MIGDFVVRAAIGYHITAPTAALAPDGFDSGYFQLSPIGMQLREIVDIPSALQSDQTE